MITWTTDPPDRPGRWLWTSARGGEWSMVPAFYLDDPLVGHQVLMVQMGSALNVASDQGHGGWLWFGPIPDPPVKVHG